MPNINEIRKGWEIGKTARPSQRFIWVACPDCGKQRWVILIRGKPKDLYCQRCGENKAQRDKMREYLNRHPELKKTLEATETKLGVEIGKPPSQARFILVSCVDCGKKRWVRSGKGCFRHQRCRSCANSLQSRKRRGEKAASWKGGRIKNAEGYILIKLQPDDPYYLMTNKRGYVPEHRLVMAKKIGRCLLRSEQVHHINSVKDDNSPENLQLLSLSEHIVRSQLCSKCPLRKDIRLVQLQNKILLDQIRELNLKIMGFGATNQDRLVQGKSN